MQLFPQNSLHPQSGVNLEFTVCTKKAKGMCELQRFLHKQIEQEKQKIKFGY